MTYILWSHTVLLFINQIRILDQNMAHLLIRIKTVTAVDFYQRECQV